MAVRLRKGRNHRLFFSKKRKKERASGALAQRAKPFFFLCFSGGGGGDPETNRKISFLLGVGHPTPSRKSEVAERGADAGHRGNRADRRRQGRKGRALSPETGLANPR